MTNEQYYDLIRPYEDAMNLMKTRLEILNHNIYDRGHTEENQPVHHMQYRIKEKKSMEEKLARIGVTDSVMNAKDYLMDIAGIRVICYFQAEVYEMVEALKRHEDLIVIKEKDYIKIPRTTATAAITSFRGATSYHGRHGVLSGGSAVPYPVHGFLVQHGAPYLLQEGQKRYGGIEEAAPCPFRVSESD